MVGPTGRFAERRRLIIAVIDPGSGNLNSVSRALSHASALEGLKAEIIVTQDAATVLKADRVVLPGQGAFAACQAGLASLSGMQEAMSEVALKRARPFLGICVGMQLLADRGLEHTTTSGLGWLAGEVGPMNPRDNAGRDLPLPQMGWNSLEPLWPHPLFVGLPAKPHAYFVHSFSWMGGIATDVLATTEYGGTVTAMVGRGNLAGTQFHVEKSGATGLTMLRNFLVWAP